MNQEYIEKLGDLLEPSKDSLGGKIYWLDQLMKKGYQVPKGYCIHSKCFYEFLEWNDISLNQIPKEGIFRYDEIRSRIYCGEFSPDLKEELIQVFDCLKKPIIVRSSAAVEDSMRKSCAGLFETVSEIIEQERFLNAVKTCWISTFNESIDKLIGGNREHGINLLIQEQVGYECGGVAYSANPITQNPNEILIESSKNGPTSVVEGHGDTIDYHFLRFEIKQQSVMLQKISEVILRVEELLGCYVDVEWVWNKSTFFLLQARPITTMYKQPVYIEVDDPDCIFYDLKNLAAVHSRWLEKKLPIRQVCKENNINIGKFYYWFRSQDKQGSQIESLIQTWDSEYIEIFDGKNIFVVKKADAVKKVNSMQQEILRIGECITTKVAGFSSVISEEKIYIEAVKGAFAGIYKGELNSTKYTVDFQDNILFAKEEEFSSEYYFDGTCCSEHEIAPVTLKIEPEYRQQIIDLTKVLNDVYPNARVEWIFDGEKIYLFDLSVEKVEMKQDYISGLILSSGSASGNVFVLEEAEILNQEVKHIFIRKGHELEQIEQKESVKKMKDQLQMSPNSILVCEYPNDNLTVLLDDIKGCIFERGSLLCHFAVILREKKIPAVILPNARKQFVNGQTIRLMDGKVML